MVVCRLFCREKEHGLNYNSWVIMKIVDTVDGPDKLFDLYRCAKCGKEVIVERYR